MEGGSSSDNAAEQAELKGGHPPAQKVGGMRVVQHKNQTDKGGDISAPASSAQPSGKAEEDDGDEFGGDKQPKPQSSVIVSGAKISEEAAFPKEAVQAFHEKPHPSHDKGHATKPKVIMQPRK